jgi:hypothetical protein
VKNRLENFAPEICAIFRLHDAVIAFPSRLRAMPQDDTAVSSLANSQWTILNDHGVLDVRDLGLS